MPRLASLCLPDLAIDRIRRAAAPHRRRPHRRGRDGDRVLPQRGGRWRPGARWAREAQPQSFVLRRAEGALVTAPAQRQSQRCSPPSARRRARSASHPACRSPRRASSSPASTSAPPIPRATPPGSRRLGLFAARRWTPRAALSGPDGLWLDLTGVAHLFGGERGDVRAHPRFLPPARLHRPHRRRRHGRRRACARPLRRASRSSSARTAAKPTRSRRCRSPRCASTRRRWPPPAASASNGSASSSPCRARRSSAASARACSLRLDQALGRAAEPFDPIVPEEPPCGPAPLPRADRHRRGDRARRAAKRSPAGAARSPKPGSASAASSSLCERVDGEEQRIAIGTARATRDGAHLLRLLCAKIETIEPGFGIERMRLVAAARRAARARSRSPARWPARRRAPDLAPLIDRLAVRLGARRLFRLQRGRKRPARTQRRAASARSPRAAGWPRLAAPGPPALAARAGRAMSSPCCPTAAAPLQLARPAPIGSPPPTGPSASMANGGGAPARRDAVRDYFQVEDEEGAPLLALPPRRRRGSRTGDLSWHLHGRVRDDLCRAPGREPFQLPARRLQRARNCSRRPPCSAIRRSASPTATASAAWSRRCAPPTRPGVRLVAGCRLDLMDGSVAAGLARGPRRLVAAHPPAHRSARAGPTARRARRANASSIGRMSPPGRRAGRGPGARRGRTRSPRSRSPRWPTFSASAAISRSPIAAARARRSGCTRSTRSPAATALRSLATGDVLYDAPDKRMLQDVVTAIREHARSTSSASAASASPTAISRARRRWSAASPPSPTRSAPRADIAERCTFSLRELELPISRRDRDVGPHAAGGAGAADPRRARRQIPGRRPAGLCATCSSMS